MCLPRKQLTLHLSLLRSFCRCGNHYYKHDAPTELAAVEPFFTQSPWCESIGGERNASLSPSNGERAPG